MTHTLHDEHSAMAAILSVIDTSFQAHQEQDVSDARSSESSDGEQNHSPTRNSAFSSSAAPNPHESALDVETSASPYELSTYLSAPGTRNRRRSDLSYNRPSLRFTIHDPNSREISLPDITPTPFESTDNTPAVEKLTYVEEIDVEKGHDVKVDSGLSTPAKVPSLSYAEGEEVSGPSAAQKARYKKFMRLHMAALCWCFCVEGWNDGTLGPLLTRIQDDYGVRG